LSYRTVDPDPAAAEIYDRLYTLYRRLYYGFGAGEILPALRRIAAESKTR
jgi:hypothetical protein